MHIVSVIAGGLVLLAVFVLFGHLWSVDASSWRRAAALAFIPAWLVVSVANLWVGVARAGYSLREEAPILALVFATPALVAALVAWRLSPG